jgi:solute carrier family 38 (sodium-coupled neutral amino acid transporter), member 2
LIGDVLSGTTSAGVHHRGILEGWFGAHLWNSRAIVLLVTTLLVFAPLVSLKRLGTLSCWHVGKIDYPVGFFF